MHRTYNYKDFTIEVETEAVAGIAGERVPATVRYIADVNITKSGSPAATRRLHFGEDTERPFGTPAEALMRGYGAAAAYRPDEERSRPAVRVQGGLSSTLIFAALDIAIRTRGV